MAGAGNSTICRPLEFVCHRSSLRFHRSIVDADIVDKAGEESACVQGAAGANEQASVCRLYILGCFWNKREKAKE